MKPPFGYMGGKQRIARQIIPHIPDHRIYVEPFFGSGGIFFAKSQRGFGGGYTEVIGDVDSNIHNFFTQLRDHGEALRDHLRLMEYSEDMYAKCKTNSEYYRNAGDFERAALFYFNQSNSFAAKQNGGLAFAAENTNVKSFVNAVERIPGYTERMRKVLIFNKPYDILIDRFDSIETFFYFDPPYKDTTGYVGGGIDHEAFAERIKETSGQWILSHYYDDWIRDNFEADGYEIRMIAHTPSIAKAKNGTRPTTGAQECIVLNTRGMSLFDL